MDRRSGRGTGVTLALLSAATFGTSGAFATSLIDAGWTPGAAVTARLAVAAAVLTPFALVQLRGRWSLVGREAAMILGYGLAAVAGAQFCYFNAVAHLSVGVALLLEYSGTILVVGWLWLRHGQRPRPLTIGGGLIAVAGLVLVLDLAGSHRLDPVGVLWGAGAAVGLAVYFVLSSRPHQSLPPLVLAWSGISVGAVVLALLGLVGALGMRAPRVDAVLAGHRVSWLVPVAGLSVVAAVVAYLVGIVGARVLGAKLASFIGLTEVLFAVAFAWALLDQVPAPVQFLGGALVLAGVALVRLDEPPAPPDQDPAAAPAGRHPSLKA